MQPTRRATSQLRALPHLSSASSLRTRSVNSSLRIGQLASASSRTRPLSYSACSSRFSGPLPTCRPSLYSKRAFTPLQQHTSFGNSARFLSVLSSSSNPATTPQGNGVPPVDPSETAAAATSHPSVVEATDASPLADAAANATSAVDPMSGIAEAAATTLANGEHIGDLAQLGLAHWTPTGLLQTVLEQLHVNLSLPWWASIGVSVLLVRAAVLPILLSVQANNSRLAAINPELSVHMKEAQNARAAGDLPGMTLASLKARNLMQKHNANSLKSLLGPVVQVPVALSFFFGIRAMCNVPVESMKMGGMGWFTDLTVADPFYILPVVSAAAMVGLLETTSRDMAQTEMSGHMRNFFRALSIVSVPMIAQLPAGLLLYFIFNGCAMVGQYFITRIPTLRAWAGILPPPATPGNLTPAALNPSYKDTFKALKNWFDNTAKQAKVQAEEQKRRQALAAAEMRSLRHVQRRTVTREDVPEKKLTQ